MRLRASWVTAFSMGCSSRYFLQRGMSPSNSPSCCWLLLVVVVVVGSGNWSQRGKRTRQVEVRDVALNWSFSFFQDRTHAKRSEKGQRRFG